MQVGVVLPGVIHWNHDLHHGTASTHKNQTGVCVGGEGCGGGGVWGVGRWVCVCMCVGVGV